MLKKQVEQYKELNKLCEESDSIHQEESIIYKEGLDDANKKIHKFKSSQKKLIIGSSVGGILLFILGLLL